MQTLHDNRHVLLAEDDDDDYYFFSMVANEISITIMLERASDGEMLMEMIDKKVPDILFLDILLPKIDGRECLRRIRANQKFDNLPVIIYTSLDPFHEIEFCFREGANFYVLKPTSIEELKSALEKIFTFDWKKIMYYPTLPDFILNHKAKS